MCSLQPAFTLADNTRCMQSRRMLHSVVEDIRQSEMRLMQSKDRSKTAHAEVAVLSDRLATLTKELESKAVVLKAAKDEIEEMTIRIYQNLEKRNGICIR